MEANNKSISRLKRVFGITYFNQGFGGLSNIPVVYFIKYVLKMGDAGGQIFSALIGIGWLIKPLWGFISDKFPLFGYKRKSWFVIMALLASFSWVLSVMLAFADIHSPALFIIVFNLVFVGYAFVDVVCDAIMVESGRRLKKVGSFVNYQWTALAISSAIAALASGWFQEQISSNNIHVGTIFLLCAIMPFFAAIIGWFNIEEERINNLAQSNEQKKITSLLYDKFYNTPGIAYAILFISAFILFVLFLKLSFMYSLIWTSTIDCIILGAWYRKKIIDYFSENKTLLYLMLFIIAWNFSPSIGYIEWSYLDSVRGIQPYSFGIFEATSGITFLVSIIAYRIVIKKFPTIKWHHYLYSMIGIWMLTFPLSFFLYLDPSHQWWNYIIPFVPDLGSWNPLPAWTRYEWFKLTVGTVIGFATIPAFLIPLTIAGESIKIANAGMYYAFLMALTNATNKVSGLIGGGLYDLLEQKKGQEGFTWLVGTFQGSWFDVAGVADERTLIIQIFIWIGLLCTFLATPFVWLLKREFSRNKIVINLNGK